MPGQRHLCWAKGASLRLTFYLYLLHKSVGPALRNPASSAWHRGAESARGRGVTFVLHDLDKYKDRAIVPAVWSACFRNFTLQISSAQLNLVILPLTDSIQSQQLCFEKALFMSGGDHVAIHLPSARWPATPTPTLCFPCFS